MADAEKEIDKLTKLKSKLFRELREDRQNSNYDRAYHAALTAEFNRVSFMLERLKGNL